MAANIESIVANASPQYAVFGTIIFVFIPSFCNWHHDIISYLENLKLCINHLEKNPDVNRV